MNCFTSRGFSGESSSVVVPRNQLSPCGREFSRYMWVEGFCSRGEKYGSGPFSYQGFQLSSDGFSLRMVSSLLLLSASRISSLDLNLFF